MTRKVMIYETISGEYCTCGGDYDIMLEDTGKHYYITLKCSYCGNCYTKKVPAKEAVTMEKFYKKK